jgi:hypothetical protein
MSMDEIKSVYEFAWLTTQQIVVTSEINGSNIKGFGSGFFSSIGISCFCNS